METRGQIQCRAPGKLFEQLPSRTVGDLDPCYDKISLQRGPVSWRQKGKLTVGLD